MDSFHVTKNVGSFRSFTKKELVTFIRKKSRVICLFKNCKSGIIKNKEMEIKHKSTNLGSFILIKYLKSGVIYKIKSRGHKQKIKSWLSSIHRNGKSQVIVKSNKSQIIYKKTNTYKIKHPRSCDATDFKIIGNSQSAISGFDFP